MNILNLVKVHNGNRMNSIDDVLVTVKESPPNFSSDIKRIKAN